VRRRDGQFGINMNGHSKGAVKRSACSRVANGLAKKFFALSEMNILLATCFYIISALPSNQACAEANLKAAEVTALLDLEWEAVSGAKGYEVSLTSQATKKAKNFQTIENRLSERLPVGTYTMKIRSKDRESGYFGPWSPDQDVDVEPKLVELIYPIEGAVLPARHSTNAEVELRWRPFPGAKKYTVSIWNLDESWRETQSTQKTQARFSIRPGASFRWKVIFESDKSIGYESKAKESTFSILGPKIEKPILQLVTQPAVKAIEWQSCAGAEWYTLSLKYRNIDETDWADGVRVSEKVPQASFKFAKKLDPGRYRLEVAAFSKNRVDSDAAVLEFTIKPTENELLETLYSPEKK
jgi:hypothetical protein